MRGTSPNRAQPRQPDSRGPRGTGGQPAGPGGGLAGMPGYEFDTPMPQRATGGVRPGTGSFPAAREMPGTERDMGEIDRFEGGAGWTDAFDVGEGTGSFPAASGGRDPRALPAYPGGQNPGPFDTAAFNAARGPWPAPPTRPVPRTQPAPPRSALPPSGPLNLRFTPTVSAGEMGAPVPPPDEFMSPPGGLPRAPGSHRAAGGARETGAFPVPRRQWTGARNPDGLDGEDDDGGIRDLRGYLPTPGSRPRGEGEGTSFAGELFRAFRGRNLISRLAIPIVAAITVGIAVVVVAGANSGNGGSVPSALATGFPPARPATADFAGTSAQAGRGISEPLGPVAASGSDIVTVGAESGARVGRTRFFFSADNGRTWEVAAEQTSDGAAPPPGATATLVASGRAGWAAVGPDAIWTSQNGQTWTFDGAFPREAGDEVTTLTATGAGFLAAGENVPSGNAARATPVVWLSADGSSWQRLGAGQLALPAPAATPAAGIAHAAANGNAILLSGGLRGSPATGTWLSTDGGKTFKSVTIGAGAGASPAVAGIAPLGSGFVAVRRATIGQTVGAFTYTSANGTAWRQAATLTTTDGAPLKLGEVVGGPGGAVVTGTAKGLLIAFLSTDGVTWNGSDPFGEAADEQVSGAALDGGGQAVIAGSSAGAGGIAAARQPLLSLIGAKGGPDQVRVTAIPGAIQPELAVNTLAADGAAQVAAGSADGFPALWSSRDGGSTWSRGTGATPTALNRAGDEQITGVTHGPAGWLAVGGGTTAGTPQHPVVVASAGGQTWTAEDGEPAFAGSGLVTSADAAGAAGYVIVGWQVSGGRRTAAAWSSSGLAGWQRATLPPAGAPDSEMTAVTATSSGFVAVGAAGGKPAVWLSRDGRTWTGVTLTTPDPARRATLQHAAASGNAVTAVGTEVTASGQSVPFAVTSANGGSSWTEAALPLSATAVNGDMAVTAVAAAGSRSFIAAGTVGTGGNSDVVIWTLQPGSRWTVATLSGSGVSGVGIHELTALTMAGSTLTGVGFAATPASEEPTIWQTPVRGLRS